jgi:1-phosphofructokinase
MIASLCANPCVDRTMTIDSFTYGGMNRIKESRDEGCGKGVNVAVASAMIGVEAACIGFMPTAGNGLILERLKRNGCVSEFVSCPGAVRVNTKVLDKASGVVTELNESGQEVSPQDVQRLVEEVVRWGGKCRYIVLAGSTPPGCPPDLYRTIIAELKKAAPGCRAVLDADGARLAEGIKASPYLIKPNRYELETLCGRKLESLQEIHAEALKLASGGVGMIAVSLGGEGAYITDGKAAFHAPALKVDVKSTVGAGDSMLAGMLLGLETDRELEEVFRLGMAAAASSVTTEGTGLIDVKLFNEFIPKIEIKRVS